MIIYIYIYFRFKEKGMEGRVERLINTHKRKTTKIIKIKNKDKSI